LAQTGENGRVRDVENSPLLLVPVPASGGPQSHAFGKAVASGTELAVPPHQIDAHARSKRFQSGDEFDSLDRGHSPGIDLDNLAWPEIGQWQSALDRRIQSREFNALIG